MEYTNKFNSEFKDFESIFAALNEKKRADTERLGRMIVTAWGAFSALLIALSLLIFVSFVLGKAMTLFCAAGVIAWYLAHRTRKRTRK